MVFIESESRPTLVRHLATGLARYRACAAGDVLRGRRSPTGGQRHQFRTTVGRGPRTTSLLDPAAVVGKRILLVDDATDTGWTLTVAARELRRAGATAVYPLVLAIR